ncbi:MAG: hypothetical protein GKR94_27350 [Gammaproteobacteria bacterium]|nr:hypothetical protein [Gammaproteobacteria bacterium]
MLRRSIIQQCSKSEIVMYETIMPTVERAARINQQLIASAGAMSEVITAAQRELASQQLTAVQAGINTALQFWQALAQAQQPADILTAQADAGQAFGTAVMDASKELWATQLATQDKLTQLVENAIQPTHSNEA